MALQKLVTIIVSTLLFKSVSSAVLLEDLYPFGSQTSDFTTPPIDDGGTHSIPIAKKFPLFNYQHDKLYVNNNGVISFLQPVTSYTPTPFPLGDGRRLIAPFWGDVDTERGGTIWYRESTDPILLNRATADVRRYFPDQIRFSAAWVFIATWENVPFYGASNTGLSNRNTFQVILITDGRHSFTVFMYNRIEWTTGSASGGHQDTGLGGTPAQVGFNAGDGINFYTVEESRTLEIINIPNLTNVNEPGIFAFQIDKETIESGGCDAEGTLVTTPRYRHMLGGEVLLMSGPCVEEGTIITVTCCGDRQLECARLTDYSLTCVTPNLAQIGDVDFKLNLTRKGGAEMEELFGQFTAVDPSRLTPSLRRVSPGSWQANVSQTVTWDMSDIDDFSVTEKHRLDAFTIEVSFISNQTFSRNVIQRPDSNTFLIFISFRNSRGIWSDVFFIRQSSETAEDKCFSWLTKEQMSPMTDSDFQPCPCDATQASLDAARFEEDPLCRLNAATNDFNCLYRQLAKQCFRQIRKSPSGAGRICCYDVKGILLNAREKTGGGTVYRNHYSRVGVVPYLSYSVQEIDPYLQCCHFSDKYCDRYFDFRKPNSCVGYVPPLPARGNGDPHIQTLDGQDYTFNGIGEYYMSNTPNGWLNVQARMEQFVDDNGDCLNLRLAVLPPVKHRNMSATVEIRLNSIRGVDVLTNGVMAGLDRTDAASTIQFNGGYARFEDISDGGKLITVALTDVDVSLRIEERNRMLNIMIFIGSKEFKGTLRGLLGNYDGDPSNDFVPRSGPMIPTDSSLGEIHNEFASTWAITTEESLFTYPVGRNHGSYQNTRFTPVLEYPDIDTVPEEVRNICLNSMECFFDYVATGSLNVARTSRSFNETWWTALIAMAEVPVCDFLPLVDMGKWSITGYRFGDNATLSCSGRTVASGQTYAMCDEHGTWNITEPPYCGVARETFKVTIRLATNGAMWHDENDPIYGETLRMANQSLFPIYKEHIGEMFSGIHVTDLRQIFTDVRYRRGSLEVDHYLYVTRDPAVLPIIAIALKNIVDGQVVVTYNSTVVLVTSITVYSTGGHDRTFLPGNGDACALLTSLRSCDTGLSCDLRIDNTPYCTSDAPNGKLLLIHQDINTVEVNFKYDMCGECYLNRCASKKQEPTRGEFKLTINLDVDVKMWYDGDDPIYNETLTLATQTLQRIYQTLIGDVFVRVEVTVIRRISVGVDFQILPTASLEIEHYVHTTGNSAIIPIIALKFTQIVHNQVVVTYNSTVVQVINLIIYDDDGHSLAIGKFKITIHLEIDVKMWYGENDPIYTDILSLASETLNKIYQDIIGDIFLRVEVTVIRRISVDVDFYVHPNASLEIEHYVHTTGNMATIPIIAVKFTQIVHNQVVVTYNSTVVQVINMIIYDDNGHSRIVESGNGDACLLFTSLKPCGTGLLCERRTDNIPQCTSNPPNVAIGKFKITIHLEIDVKMWYGENDPIYIDILRLASETLEKIYQDIIGDIFLRVEVTVIRRISVDVDFYVHPNASLEIEHYVYTTGNMATIPIIALKFIQIVHNEVVVTYNSRVVQVINLIIYDDDGHSRIVESGDRDVCLLFTSLKPCSTGLVCERRTDNTPQCTSNPPDVAIGKFKITIHLEIDVKMWYGENDPIYIDILRLASETLNKIYQDIIGDIFLRVEVTVIRRISVDVDFYVHPNASLEIEHYVYTTGNMATIPIIALKFIQIVHNGVVVTYNSRVVQVINLIIYDDDGHSHPIRLMLEKIYQDLIGDIFLRVEVTVIRRISVDVDFYVHPNASLEIEHYVYTTGNMATIPIIALKFIQIVHNGVVVTYNSRVVQVINLIIYDDDGHSHPIRLMLEKIYQDLIGDIFLRVEVTVIRRISVDVDFYVHPNASLEIEHYVYTTGNMATIPIIALKFIQIVHNGVVVTYNSRVVQVINLIIYDDDGHSHPIRLMLEKIYQDLIGDIFLRVEVTVIRRISVDVDFYVHPNASLEIEHYVYTTGNMATIPIIALKFIQIVHNGVVVTYNSRVVQVINLIIYDDDGHSHPIRLMLEKIYQDLIGDIFLRVEVTVIRSNPPDAASGKLKITINLDIDVKMWYGVTDPIYIEILRMASKTLEKIYQDLIGDIFLRVEVTVIRRISVDVDFHVLPTASLEIEHYVITTGNTATIPIIAVKFIQIVHNQVVVVYNSTVVQVINMLIYDDDGHSHPIRLMLEKIYQDLIGDIFLRVEVTVIRRISVDVDFHVLPTASLEIEHYVITTGNTATIPIIAVKFIQIVHNQVVVVYNSTVVQVINMLIYDDDGHSHPIRLMLEKIYQDLIGDIFLRVEVTVIRRISVDVDFHVLPTASLEIEHYVITTGNTATIPIIAVKFIQIVHNQVVVVYNSTVVQVINMLIYDDDGHSRTVGSRDQDVCLLFTSLKPCRTGLVCERRTDNTPQCTSNPPDAASGKLKITINLDIDVKMWYGVTDPIYIEILRMASKTLEKIYQDLIGDIFLRVEVTVIRRISVDVDFHVLPTASLEIEHYVITTGNTTTIPIIAVKFIQIVHNQVVVVYNSTVVQVFNMLIYDDDGHSRTVGSRDEDVCLLFTSLKPCRTGLVCERRTDNTPQCTSNPPDAASGKLKITINLDIDVKMWYGVTDPIYIEILRMASQTLEKIYQDIIGDIFLRVKVTVIRILADGSLEIEHYVHTTGNSTTIPFIAVKFTQIVHNQVVVTYNSTVVQVINMIIYDDDGHSRTVVSGDGDPCLLLTSLTSCGPDRHCALRTDNTPYCTSGHPNVSGGKFKFTIIMDIKVRGWYGEKDPIYIETLRLVTQTLVRMYAPSLGESLIRVEVTAIRILADGSLEIEYYVHTTPNPGLGPVMATIITKIVDSKVEVIYNSTVVYVTRLTIFNDSGDSRTVVSGEGDACLLLTSLTSCGPDRHCALRNDNTPYCTSGPPNGKMILRTEHLGIEVDMSGGKFKLVINLNIKVTALYGENDPIYIETLRLVTQTLVRMYEPSLGESLIRVEVTAIRILADGSLEIEYYVHTTPNPDLGPVMATIITKIVDSKVEVIYNSTVVYVTRLTIFNDSGDSRTVVSGEGDACLLLTSLTSCGPDRHCALRTDNTPYCTSGPPNGKMILRTEHLGIEVDMSGGKFKLVINLNIKVTAWYGENDPIYIETLRLVTQTLVRMYEPSLGESLIRVEVTAIRILADGSLEIEYYVHTTPNPGLGPVMATIITKIVDSKVEVIYNSTVVYVTRLTIFNDSGDSRTVVSGEGDACLLLTSLTSCGPDRHCALRTDNTPYCTSGPPNVSGGKFKLVINLNIKVTAWYSENDPIYIETLRLVTRTLVRMYEPSLGESLIRVEVTAIRILADGSLEIEYYVHTTPNPGLDPVMATIITKIVDSKVEVIYNSTVVYVTSLTIFNDSGDSRTVVSGEGDACLLLTSLTSCGPDRHCALRTDNTPYCTSGPPNGKMILRTEHLGIEVDMSGGKFKLVINLNIKVTAWYGENDPIYIETLRLVTQTLVRMYEPSLGESLIRVEVTAIRILADGSLEIEYYVHTTPNPGLGPVMATIITKIVDSKVEVIYNSTVVYVTRLTIFNDSGDSRTVVSGGGDACLLLTSLTSCGPDRHCALRTDNTPYCTSGPPNVSGGKFKLVINLNIKVTAWYGENDPIYIETLRLVTQTLVRMYEPSLGESLIRVEVTAIRILAGGSLEIEYYVHTTPNPGLGPVMATIITKIVDSKVEVIYNSTVVYVTRLTIFNDSGDSRTVVSGEGDACLLLTSLTSCGPDRHCALRIDNTPYCTSGPPNVSGGKFKLVINLNIKVTAWYGENDPIYIETLRLVTQTLVRMYEPSLGESLIRVEVTAIRILADGSLEIEYYVHTTPNPGLGPVMATIITKIVDSKVEVIYNSTVVYVTRLTIFNDSGDSRTVVSGEGDECLLLTSLTSCGPDRHCALRTDNTPYCTSGPPNVSGGKFKLVINLNIKVTAWILADGSLEIEYYVHTTPNPGLGPVMATIITKIVDSKVEVIYNSTVVYVTRLTIFNDSGDSRTVVSGEGDACLLLTSLTSCDPDRHCALRTDNTPYCTSGPPNVSGGKFKLVINLNIKVTAWYGENDPIYIETFRLVTQTLESTYKPLLGDIFIRVEITAIRILAGGSLEIEHYVHTTVNPSIIPFITVKFIQIVHNQVVVTYNSTVVQVINMIIYDDDGHSLAGGKLKITFNLDIDVKMWYGVNDPIYIEILRMASQTLESTYKPLLGDVFIRVEITAIRILAGGSLEIEHYVHTTVNPSIIPFITVKFIQIVHNQVVVTYNSTVVQVINMIIYDDDGHSLAGGKLKITFNLDIDVKMWYGVNDPIYIEILRMASQTLESTYKPLLGDVFIRVEITAIRILAGGSLEIEHYVHTTGNPSIIPFIAVKFIQIVHNQVVVTYNSTVVQVINMVIYDDDGHSLAGGKLKITFNLDIDVKMWYGVNDPIYIEILRMASQTLESTHRHSLGIFHPCRNHGYQLESTYRPLLGDIFIRVEITAIRILAGGSLEIEHYVHTTVNPSIIPFIAVKFIQIVHNQVVVTYNSTVVQVINMIIYDDDGHSHPILLMGGGKLKITFNLDIDVKMWYGVNDPIYIEILRMASQTLESTYKPLLGDIFIRVEITAIRSNPPNVAGGKLKITFNLDIDVKMWYGVNDPIYIEILRMASQTLESTYRPLLGDIFIRVEITAIRILAGGSLEIEHYVHTTVNPSIIPFIAVKFIQIVHNQVVVTYNSTVVQVINMIIYDDDGHSRTVESGDGDVCLLFTSLKPCSTGLVCERRTDNTPQCTSNPPNVAGGKLKITFNLDIDVKMWYGVNDPIYIEILRMASQTLESTYRPLLGDIFIRVEITAIRILAGGSLEIEHYVHTTVNPSIIPFIAVKFIQIVHNQVVVTYNSTVVQVINMIIYDDDGHSRTVESGDGDVCLLFTSLKPCSTGLVCERRTDNTPQCTSDPPNVAGGKLKITFNLDIDVKMWYGVNDPIYIEILRMASQTLESTYRPLLGDIFIRVEITAIRILAGGSLEIEHYVHTTVNPSIIPFIAVKFIQIVHNQVVVTYNSTVVQVINMIIYDDDGHSLAGGKLKITFNLDIDVKMWYGVNDPIYIEILRMASQTLESTYRPLLGDIFIRVEITAIRILAGGCLEIEHYVHTTVNPSIIPFIAVKFIQIVHNQVVLTYNSTVVQVINMIIYDDDGHSLAGGKLKLTLNLDIHVKMWYGKNDPIYIEILSMASQTLEKIYQDIIGDIFLRVEVTVIRILADDSLEIEHYVHTTGNLATTPFIAVKFTQLVHNQVVVTYNSTVVQVINMIIYDDDGHSLAGGKLKLTLNLDIHVKMWYGKNDPIYIEILSMASQTLEKIYQDIIGDIFLRVEVTVIRILADGSLEIEHYVHTTGNLATTPFIAVKFTQLVHNQVVVTYNSTVVQVINMIIYDDDGHSLAGGKLKLTLNLDIHVKMWYGKNDPIYIEILSMASQTLEKIYQDIIGDIFLRVEVTVIRILADGSLEIEHYVHTTGNLATTPFIAVKFTQLVHNQVVVTYNSTVVQVINMIIYDDDGHSLAGGKLKLTLNLDIHVKMWYGKNDPIYIEILSMASQTLEKIYQDIIGDIFLRVEVTVIRILADGSLEIEHYVHTTGNLATTPFIAVKFTQLVHNQVVVTYNSTVVQVINMIIYDDDGHSLAGGKLKLTLNLDIHVKMWYGKNDPIYIEILSMASQTLEKIYQDIIGDIFLRVEVTVIRILADGSLEIEHYVHTTGNLATTPFIAVKFTQLVHNQVVVTYNSTVVQVINMIIYDDDGHSLAGGKLKLTLNLDIHVKMWYGKNDPIYIEILSMASQTLEKIYQDIIGDIFLRVEVTVIRILADGSLEIEHYVHTTGNLATTPFIAVKFTQLVHNQVVVTYNSTVVQVINMIIYDDDGHSRIVASGDGDVCLLFTSLKPCSTGLVCERRTDNTPQCTSYPPNVAGGKLKLTLNLDIHVKMWYGKNDPIYIEILSMASQTLEKIYQDIIGDIFLRVEVTVIRILADGSLEIEHYVHTTGNLATTPFIAVKFTQLVHNQVVVTYNSTVVQVINMIIYDDDGHSRIVASGDGDVCLLFTSLKPCSTGLVCERRTDNTPQCTSNPPNVAGGKLKLTLNLDIHVKMWYGKNDPIYIEILSMASQTLEKIYQDIIGDIFLRVEVTVIRILADGSLEIEHYVHTTGNLATTPFIAVKFTQLVHNQVVVTYNSTVVQVINMIIYDDDGHSLAGGKLKLTLNLDIHVKMWYGKNDPIYIEILSMVSQTLEKIYQDIIGDIFLRVEVTVIRIIADGSLEIEHYVHTTGNLATIPFIAVKFTQIVHNQVVVTYNSTVVQVINMIIYDDDGHSRTVESGDGDACLLFTSLKPCNTGLLCERRTDNTPQCTSNPPNVAGGKLKITFNLDIDVKMWYGENDPIYIDILRMASQTLEKIYQDIIGDIFLRVDVTVIRRISVGVDFHVHPTASLEVEHYVHTTGNSATIPIIAVKFTQIVHNQVVVTYNSKVVQVISITIYNDDGDSRTVVSGDGDACLLLTSLTSCGQGLQCALRTDNTPYCTSGPPNVVSGKFKLAINLDIDVKMWYDENDPIYIETLRMAIQTLKKIYQESIGDIFVRVEVKVLRRRIMEMDHHTHVSLEVEHYVYATPNAVTIPVMAATFTKVVHNQIAMIYNSSAVQASSITIYNDDGDSRTLLSGDGDACLILTSMKSCDTDLHCVLRTNSLPYCTSDSSKENMTLSTEPSVTREEFKLSIKLMVDVEMWINEHDLRYSETRNMATQSLKRTYQDNIGDMFVGVEVTAIRRGSLVVDHYVYTDTDRSSAPVLAKSLTNIIDGHAALIYNSTVAEVISATVYNDDGDNRTVKSGDGDACLILTSLRPCDTGTHCELRNDNMPYCTSFPPDASYDKSKLTTAVGVGVPLAVILIVIGAVVVIWIMRRRQNRYKPNIKVMENANSSDKLGPFYPTNRGMILTWKKPFGGDIPPLNGSNNTGGWFDSEKFSVYDPERFSVEEDYSQSYIPCHISRSYNRGFYTAIPLSILRLMPFPLNALTSGFVLYTILGVIVMLLRPIKGALPAPWPSELKCPILPRQTGTCRLSNTSVDTPPTGSQCNIDQGFST
ncbi:hypothetical protein ScPMuIL_009769 [Solemya velum]